MKSNRVTLRTAQANLVATQEARRSAETHDDARRQAVLYHGTRFTHPQEQAATAAAVPPQVRKRRAKLPQPRRHRGDIAEDEHGHAPSHEERHQAVRRQGNDSGGSSGGDHSHGRHGERDDSQPKAPKVRSASAAPVPPYAGGALPVSPGPLTDVEHAEAVRAAFCNALLALRDDPGASRAVGAAELQLERLDARRACQSLCAPEEMSGLRQRLIDASKDTHGKKNPFNLLLPLLLLVNERPLTAAREQGARSTLTSHRNATLARAHRTP